MLMYLSVICIIFGIVILIKPAFYSTQFEYFFDFSKIKWPLGIFFILFGAIMLWLTVKKEGKETRYLICLKCKKIFDVLEFRQDECPQCKVQLESLNGFYEKHPELKKDSVKKN
jgi:hypothetical protein